MTAVKTIALDKLNKAEVKASRESRGLSGEASPGPFKVSVVAASEGISDVLIDAVSLALAVSEGFIVVVKIWENIKISF